MRARLGVEKRASGARGGCGYFRDGHLSASLTELGRRATGTGQANAKLQKRRLQQTQSCEIPPDQCLNASHTPLILILVRDAHVRLRVRMILVGYLRGFASCLRCTWDAITQNEKWRVGACRKLFLDNILVGSWGGWSQVERPRGARTHCTESKYLTKKRAASRLRVSTMHFVNVAAREGPGSPRYRDFTTIQLVQGGSFVRSFVRSFERHCMSPRGSQGSRHFRNAHPQSLAGKKKRLQKTGHPKQTGISQPQSHARASSRQNCHVRQNRTLEVLRHLTSNCHEP